MMQVCYLVGLRERQEIESVLPTVASITHVEGNNRLTIKL